MNDNKPIVELKPLTKEIVTENVAMLIEMSKQLHGDYWNLEHYLTDYNRKWELSSVIYVEGQIGGFIIVSEKPGSLHVHRIVISEALQNIGIGKMLINKTIADAQRLAKDAVTLKAESDNTKTIGFYKKMNFEITGDQDVLVLMTLKIAS